MDEAAFRVARTAAIAQPCVFEKALLARCSSCEVAARHALAEREAIACSSPVARTNCGTLLAMLRERSAFALKLPAGAPLPHALTMRLQCGGLRGLRKALDADESDVHRLVVAARERHDGFAHLPWPVIVAAVQSWQGGRRHAGDRE